MKQIFLTYNEWNGDTHKGTDIDHKGLTAGEVQQAIDDFNKKYYREIEVNQCQNQTEKSK